MSYYITRFRHNADSTVLRRGLTLQEAQEHCRREGTHGFGWFDGYGYEDEENNNDG